MDEDVDDVPEIEEILTDSSDDYDEIPDDNYAVGAILAHNVAWFVRQHGASVSTDLSPNQVVYLIRWAGYGADCDTWEPAKNLEYAPDIFAGYCELNNLHGQDRYFNNDMN